MNEKELQRISRQAAIELVKDVCEAIMSGCESWYDPETEDEVCKDILEVDAILKCNKEIRKALKAMPSAQLQRKKGEWNKYYRMHSGGYIYLQQVRILLCDYTGRR